MLPGTNDTPHDLRHAARLDEGQMPDLLDMVHAFSAEHGLFDAGPLILGVSGGLDSMVLLDLLTRIEPRRASPAEPTGSRARRVIAAHVNYGLREGADADEALVREWCAACDPPVPVEVHRASLSPGDAASTQEEARDIRYAFFRRLARRHGARAVAVAHHRGDQAETVLLRLFRGSGPTGLGGMAPSRALDESGETSLVRPLLDISKEELKRYAEARDLPWRDDPTNTSGPYARARLRTDVLPAIEQAFPGATGRIAHAGTLLRQLADDTLDPKRTRLLKSAFEPAEGDEPPGGWLHLDRLRAMSTYWRRRIILDALERSIPTAPRTSGVARAVDDLLDAQVGRKVMLGQGAVWRERNALFLEPQGPTPVDPRPLAPGDSIQTEVGIVCLTSVPLPSKDDLQTAGDAVAHIDADRLAGDLRLRSWRAGDRIQPLGMAGTKPVSDVLTDAKTPPHLREQMLVVADTERIVWVVGLRVHHDVRIRPSTSRALKLHVSSDPELL